MLSQSLYIPSEGTLYKSLNLRKPIPEVRDMAKELTRLEKYNLDFKRELDTKYKISKIYTDFEDSLSNYNLESVVAPFITNTFHVQRKKAFKSLEDLIKDESFDEKQAQYRNFIAKIDKEELVKFKYLIKEPYVNLVFQKHYNLPKNIDLKQIKEGDAYKELYNLSLMISIWSIEIELLADLIERATLYKLYQPVDEKTSVINRLKMEKNLQNKFTVEGFSKKLLRSVAVKFIQRLSGFFSSKGLSYTSISWSACQGILAYIMGTAAFPWACIVGNVSIPWICGGFLATKLLENVGKKISRTEVIDDLKYLENAIGDHAEELMEQYRGICDAIDKCLAAESEKELDFFKDVLKKKINYLLEANSEPKVGPQNGHLNQSRLCLSMLVVEESDDWVICDLREDEEQDENDEDISEDIVCSTIIKN